MKKNYALFTILILVNLYSLKAQLWWKLISDESLNYYEVVRQLDEYYKDRDKGQGSGYKQYQRWKYLQYFHIDSTGNRISAEQEYAEYEKYMRMSAHNPQARTSAGVWVELGPKNWSRTSGWNPGVGRVMAIDVDPSNANTIYVGTPGGGCWKSVNGGSTWNVLTDNFSSLSVTAVTVDPSNSNTVFIGCGANRLMKSNDGGTSWNNANTGLGGTVRKILIHPTNSTIVFAATSAGLYRSTNSGANWTSVYGAAMNDIEFKPGDPSIVYSCGSNFYRSSDGGATFTQITSGIIDSDRSFISVTPANADYVYMVMANGNEFGYLFRSTDSGLNFSTRVTGSAATSTNYFGYSANGSDTGGQAGYDMAMCVSSTNAEEVYIAGIICWKSTNGGTSFTSITEWALPNTRGYNHADVHVLEYRNGVIYSGSDGGIYKSTDFGDNWTDLSSGLGIRQFYRIGCAKTNNDLVTGGAQDNGTSIRRTTGWIDWLGADGMESFFDHTNANIVYGTSQSGSLYKSTNGGNSYFGLTEPATNGNWVTPFEIDPVTPTTIYVGYIDLYKSINGGTSWTALTALTTGNFDQLAIAPSDPNYIYASKDNVLYRTSDGGATWTTVTTPSGNINYITVHPSTATSIAVACNNTRVYTSTDAGTTWTNYTGTMTGTFNCVVYHNGTDNGLYLATNNGVFYRNNTMTAWIPYLSGLPNVEVRELEIHYPSQKIRAGTYGRGLWETDLYEALPVYYLSFDAENAGEDAVRVFWATSSEFNSDRFEVQRSHNGRDFFSIGTVLAANNSSSTRHYEWIDNTPLFGTSYYRLLQYDKDGTGRYTNYAIVERSTGQRTIFAYPNPSNEYFNVLVSDKAKESVRLRVLHMNGTVVIERNDFMINQLYKIGEELPAGIYIIETSDKESQQRLKVIKQ